MKVLKRHVYKIWIYNQKSIMKNEYQTRRSVHRQPIPCLTVGDPDAVVNKNCSFQAV